MREITNSNQNLSFLNKVCELRGLHSNSLLDMRTAARKFKARAKDVWHGDENLRQADGVMRSFIEDNYLIKSEFREQARHILDQLERFEYGFKRQNDSVRDAISRFSAEHRANSYFRPEYRQALEWVTTNLKPKYWLMTVQFPSVDSFKEFLSNKKASSGAFACYTYVNKKGDALTKEILSLLHDIERWAVKNGSMDEPTLPGIRLQASIPLNDAGELKYIEADDGKVRLDFKYKTRLINMVSLPRIFSEMHYSIELQAYFGSLEWYAGGKNMEQLQQTLQSYRYDRRFGHWDSLDYSSYDQSLPGWFINDAFKIVKTWFQLSEYESKLFDVIVGDFIHKGLVADEKGNIVRIHDGVESGSMFTQIIDTLCNFIMMTHFCILNGKEMFTDCKCHICGDDNIVFHGGWFNSKNYLDFIYAVYGVKGNLDKSQTNKDSSQDPEYLSRSWTPQGPYRPWFELLVKLVYHERYRVYDSQVTPQLIVAAFDQCYHLGMLEGFDMHRFYSLYPNCSRGSNDEEAIRAIGGIVAYENLYGHKR